jgi:hypothetical protein
MTMDENLAEILGRAQEYFDRAVHAKDQETRRPQLAESN